MQTQPCPAVFPDDVRLLNVLALKQGDQALDACIPLVGDVRQYQRQIEQSVCQRPSRPT